MPPGLVQLQEGEKPYQPPPPPQMMLMVQKGKTEELKQQNQLVINKIKLVELAKEISETKDEQNKDVRKAVLSILAELHAPQHPADTQQGGQDGN